MQGIHNIFVVMPQFIMTAVTAVIFALVEPDKSAISPHSLSAPVNGSASVGTDASARMLLLRDDAVVVSAKPNSYAIVFR